MYDSRQNERLNIIRRASYIYSQHAMPQTVRSHLADCIHWQCLTLQTTVTYIHET